jgi:mevalonate kinase
MQTDATERILRAMHVDVAEHHLRISFQGDLLAGSGIGASAASCVALARAISDEWNLELDDGVINEIAFEGEKGYHGEPGGVDNTASTYGGVLWFQKDRDGGVDHVERLTLPASLWVVLANSGINVDTSKVVAYKKKLVKDNRALFAGIFKTLTAQARELRHAIETGDNRKAGLLMNEHHRILREHKFSHDTIDRLVDRALGAGALGAKVTGGGMGGYMLALVADEITRGKVSTAIQELGFTTVETKVGT